MESLSVDSNCSLHTGEVELKSQELATVDPAHLERVDSVESFQTGTSTETYETVSLNQFYLIFEFTCQISYI